MGESCIVRRSQHLAFSFLLTVVIVFLGIIRFSNWSVPLPQPGRIFAPPASENDVDSSLSESWWSNECPFYTRLITFSVQGDSRNYTQYFDAFLSSPRVVIISIGRDKVVEPEIPLWSERITIEVTASDSNGSVVSSTIGCSKRITSTFPWGYMYICSDLPFDVSAMTEHHPSVFSLRFLHLFHQATHERITILSPSSPLQLSRCYLSTRPRYEYAVFTVARNMKERLVEWISYHLFLGFAHVFIIDHGSTDGTYERLIERFSRDEVSVGKALWHAEYGGGYIVQQKMMMADLSFRFRGAIDWVLLTDVDEYVVILPSLREFVEVKKKDVERFDQTHSFKFQMLPVCCPNGSETTESLLSQVRKAGVHDIFGVGFRNAPSGVPRSKVLISVEKTRSVVVHYATGMTMATKEETVMFREGFMLHFLCHFGWKRDFCGDKGTWPIRHDCGLVEIWGRYLYLKDTEPILKLADALSHPSEDQKELEEAKRKVMSLELYQCKDHEPFYEV